MAELNHISNNETFNAIASISMPDNENDFGFLDEFLKSCGSTQESNLEAQGSDDGSPVRPSNITPLLLEHSFNINPKLAVSVGLNLNHNFVGTVQFRATNNSNRPSALLEVLWDEWGELNHHNLSISTFLEKKATTFQGPICETCGAATKVPFPSLIKVTEELSIEFVKKIKMNVVNIRKNKSCVQLLKNDSKKLVEIKELISLRLKRLNQIHFTMFYQSILNTLMDNPMLNASTAEHVHVLLEKYAKSNTAIVYECL